MSNATDITFKLSDAAFRNMTIIVEPGIRCTSMKVDGLHGDELIEDCRDFPVVQLRQPIRCVNRCSQEWQYDIQTLEEERSVLGREKRT